MKPQEQTITVNVSGGTAVSTATPWLTMNHQFNDFKVGFGVSHSGAGDANFSVEHTFVDVLNGGSAGSSEIFEHSEVSGQDVSGDAAAADGNYAFPVAAIRLALTSASGNNTLTFRVIQLGV